MFSLEFFIFAMSKKEVLFINEERFLLKGLLLKEPT